MKETALERLSKINSVSDFGFWLREAEGYQNQVEDIQEVVALAKSNQQPSIDAMRFQLAKDISIAFFSNPNCKIENSTESAQVNVAYADALIAELQKPNP